MGYTAYSCENQYIKKIRVAGNGLSNGNSYAEIHIYYEDSDMIDVIKVRYVEVGNNGFDIEIGNDIEWCEDDDRFKVLKDGEYVDSSDKDDDIETDKDN